MHTEKPEYLRLFSGEAVLGCELRAAGWEYFCDQ
jgi:hypothetical protein